MDRCRRISFAVIGLLLAALPARASLVGSVIDGAYYFGTTASPYENASVSPTPFTVGAGTEALLTVDGNVFTTIDFAASSLILTATTDVDYANAAYNGLKSLSSPATASARCAPSPPRPGRWFQPP
ncbi:hypothetical protein ACFQU2_28515 [Siccirubricoccus deserti]